MCSQSYNIHSRCAFSRNVCLFFHSCHHQVTPEVAQHLSTAGVAVKPYSDVVGDVVGLAKRGIKILMDPSKVSLALYDAASAAAVAGAAAKEAGPRGKRKRTDKANGAQEEAVKSNGHALVEKLSPVYDAKAIKNEQVCM